MYYKFLVFIAVMLLLFACTDSTKNEPTVTTPQFNPAASTYSQVQYVSISCPAVPGAKIRYTLDGTNPTTSSALFVAGSPLLISAETTLKARGYQTNMKASPIATGHYILRIPNLYFSPLANTFDTPTEITINSTIPNVNIHYTLDGTEPTETSPVYSVPIALDGNTTIKAKGFIPGWISSDTFTKVCVFNTAMPDLSVAAGSYWDPINLSISTTTIGAEIHYTIDGSEPTTASPLYSSALSLEMNQTIKAKTFKDNWTPSETRIAAYTFKVRPVAFDLAAGTFTSPQSVSMSEPTPETTIHYTTGSGETPTINSPLYTSPVPITINTTLKARAVRNGWTDSDFTTAVYNLQVSPPVFDLPSGNYDNEQIINITCPNAGSSIRYTTNNTEPTSTSTLYTGPVHLTQTTTLRAKAFKDNWLSSLITNALYQITGTVATPTFNPDPSVEYSGPQQVEIFCATPQAAIHYTLDGSDPTIDSDLYFGPIDVPENIVIKAIGTKPGMNPSIIAEANYIIINTVQNPVFDPDPATAYTSAILVTITTTTEDVDLRYTLDGTEPTEASIQYIAPLILAANTQIKVKGFRVNYVASETITANYLVDTASTQIIGWGLNDQDQLTSIATGLNFQQVDTGAAHTVALRTVGTLAAWGNNGLEQCDVPAGSNYIEVSAGGNHSLALNTAHEIFAWGDGANDLNTVPPNAAGYYAISAGGAHSLAITMTNGLVAWGSNTYTQCDVPDGNDYAKIAAGKDFNIALKNDGSLVAWGRNIFGVLDVPPGNDFTDIAAGDKHCLARRTDGTIVAWGNIAAYIIGPTFQKVATGYNHNMALTTDGTIITWDADAITAISAVNGYIDISGGDDFSVAIKSNLPGRKHTVTKPRIRFRQK